MIEGAGVGMTFVKIDAQRRWHMSGRIWLIAAFVAGVTIAFLSPTRWGAVPRLILAWDCAVILWLIAIIVVVRPGVAFLVSPTERFDVGWAVSLIMVSASVIASLVAIAHLLSGVKSLPLGEKLDHVAASFLTIALSWMALHTLYALHYVHLCIRQTDSTMCVRGLSFPETPEPTFSDFLYFSITIGATSQTSDVVVTTSMLRRRVTAHAIISFAYNTCILALTINIGASNF